MSTARSWPCVWPSGSSAFWTPRSGTSSAGDRSRRLSSAITQRRPSSEAELAAAALARAGAGLVAGHPGLQDLLGRSSCCGQVPAAERRGNA